MANQTQILGASALAVAGVVYWASRPRVEAANGDDVQAGNLPDSSFKVIPQARVMHRSPAAIVVPGQAGELSGAAVVYSATVENPFNSTFSGHIQLQLRNENGNLLTNNSTSISVPPGQKTVGVTSSTVSQTAEVGRIHASVQFLDDTSQVVMTDQPSGHVFEIVAAGTLTQLSSHFTLVGLTAPSSIVLRPLEAKPTPVTNQNGQPQYPKLILTYTTGLRVNGNIDIPIRIDTETWVSGSLFHTRQEFATITVAGVTVSTAGEVVDENMPPGEIRYISRVINLLTGQEDFTADSGVVADVESRSGLTLVGSSFGV